MRPVRVAVAGSVDDGKSTLLGRLMNDSGRVFTDEVEAVRKASRSSPQTEAPESPLRSPRAEARGPITTVPGDVVTRSPSTPLGTSGLNLAFFTDGLQRERRDGITLDVAWRHLTLGTRRLLLADVPGHVELVHNMATGASTADAALLLVDAERGVQPQTRRHLVMLSGLGVRHVLVCINKMDGVGFAQSVAQTLTAQLQALASALGVTLEVIPVSALDGDNVVRPSQKMPWYTGPTVALRLETLEPVPSSPLLRAVVQLGSDDGGWTALHLLSGEVQRGQALVAWPQGTACRVLEVSPHGLGRVRLEPAVQRGTLLTLSTQPPKIATEAELTVTWLAESQRVVTLLQHGRRTPARLVDPLLVASLETGAFEPRSSRAVSPLDANGSGSPFRAGDVGRVRVVFEAPTWFDLWHDSAATATCLLLDSAGRTVAGGRFT